MNDLISVPSWTPKTVSYLINVEHYINGVMRCHTTNPPRWYDRDLKKECDKYFNKFIFRTFTSDIMRDDPLECLKLLMEKHKDLNFDKFINKKIEKLSIKKIPENVDSMHFNVEYWEVREQIISYIEQKVGKSKKLEELKDLFSEGNTMSFEEYLNKKSKQLSEMDCEGYLKMLNEDTEKRRELKNGINGIYCGKVSK